ncbi:MAG: hypothetical protein GX811_00280 [Lentisphaerae bacterium]|nr:hypothetical protein [Lentisphaerota bacterium]
MLALIIILLYQLKCQREDRVEPKIDTAVEQLEDRIEEPAPATTKTSPVRSAPEYSEREKKIRNDIKERLDKRSPIAEPGETTELRRKNGIITKGSFVGLKDDQVIIRRFDDQEISIPLDELDTVSRAKCDPEFRQNAFEQEVKKQLQQRSEF